MNRAEAEALLATGVEDAEELVRRWGAMSAEERRESTPEERARHNAAWERINQWPSASALARQVLDRPTPPTDTLEAMETRRRRSPLESRVTAQDVLNARWNMGPLDDDAEPDVVDALVESVLGPGWLRGERR